MTISQHDNITSLQYDNMTILKQKSVSTIWQAFTIHYDVMNSHVDRELCHAKNANNQRIRHAEHVR